MPGMPVIGAEIVADMANIPEPAWRSPQGDVVSCAEKLKVLRENLEEIRQLCEEALEDAAIMGCDVAQFRGVLAELVHKLENRYPER